MKFPRIPQFLQLAALVLLAAGAQPVGAAVWQWSQTASSNATADPTINWAEGMSPSSVNDSARAMMSGLARYRDDISGLLTTAGTGAAYTVTTNQGLAATPNDGQLIAVTVNATNTTGATLAADGGNVFPIQTSPGAAVGAGVLISGSPYTLKYSVANSAWMLRDYFGNPFSIPLGAMLPYTGDAAPNSNFALPYGQCISRTTYSGYFALVGTRYGVCDGTTTYALPDYRGRIPMACDNLGGTNANRIPVAAANCGNPTVTGLGVYQIAIQTINLPSLIPTGSIDSHFIGAQQFFGGTTNPSVQQGAASFVPSTATNSVLIIPDNWGISSTFSGNQIGGNSTPIVTIQPSLASAYILRIF